MGPPGGHLGARGGSRRPKAILEPSGDEKGGLRKSRGDPWERAGVRFAPRLPIDSSFSYFLLFAACFENALAPEVAEVRFLVPLPSNSLFFTWRRVLAPVPPRRLLSALGALLAPLAGLVGARWWPKGAPRAENSKKQNVQNVWECWSKSALGGRQVEPGSGLEWSLVVSGGGRWWVVVGGGEKWC